MSAVIQARPIIVSALFGNDDFAWLDRQRQLYFPPDRNQLRAHLTMFHHLPPSCVDELCSRLRAATQSPPPAAFLNRLMSLGYGVAYHIRSDELNAIRNDIAEAFGPLLTPQDRAGWRPHVTIQNKTKPDIAKALLARLILEFRERPIDIAGLAAWWYDGGSWQPIAAYRFGGGVPMKHPPPLIAG